MRGMESPSFSLTCNLSFIPGHRSTLFGSKTLVMRFVQIIRMEGAG